MKNSAVNVLVWGITIGSLVTAFVIAVAHKFNELNSKLYDLSKSHDEVDRRINEINRAAERMDGRIKTLLQDAEK